LGLFQSHSYRQGLASKYATDGTPLRATSNKQQTEHQPQSAKFPTLKTKRPTTQSQQNHATQSEK